MSAVRRGNLFASSAMLAAILATTAHAQSGAAPSGTTQVAQAEQTNVIAEVVVTAEKREESLQDVPVAVTAFTSERRDLVGITTVQDLTNFTPGLQYSTQIDRTSLRGIGRLTNVHSAEGGVAIYSDQVYTTSTVEAGRRRFSSTVSRCCAVRRAPSTAATPSPARST
jgi:iron complex outermembrane receptor protein